MADISQIGLLIDGETLYGVSSADNRVLSWQFGSRQDGAPSAELDGDIRHPATDNPTTRRPDDPTGEPLNDDGEGAVATTPSTGEGPAFAASTSSTPPTAVATLAEALASARSALKADDGCVLALPPDVLVAKVVSLPPVEPDAIGPMVRLQMEKFAPASGDALEVASEVVGATDDATRVFAVAMPMSRLGALADDLSSSSVLLTRIDSSLLCEWRAFADYPSKPELPTCHGVIFALPSGRFDLAIADESGLVFARSLGSRLDASGLVREIVLSVLNLGGEAGGLAPGGFVFVSDEPPPQALADGLRETLGVETIPLPGILPDDYARALLRRDLEEGHIDIVPPQWRDDEAQHATRRRFIAGVVAAVAVWALGMAALFIAPLFLQRSSDAVKTSLAEIDRDYREVAETRAKVRLIRSYQDRSHSLLEILRTICVKMPDGIIFSSLSYEKGGETVSGSKTKTSGGVKIAGDAGDSPTIYAFKDILDNMGPFAPAGISGPTLDAKRSRFRFEFDSRFNDSEAAQ